MQEKIKNILIFFIMFNKNRLYDLFSAFFINYFFLFYFIFQEILFLFRNVCKSSFLDCASNSLFFLFYFFFLKAIG